MLAGYLSLARRGTPRRPPAVDDGARNLPRKPIWPIRIRQEIQMVPWTDRLKKTELRGIFDGVDCHAHHAVADRTRCRVAVSQQREYFKYPPETIGDMAREVAKFGA